VPLGVITQMETPRIVNIRSSSQLFPPNLGLFLVSRLRIMWLFEVPFYDYSSPDDQRRLGL